MKILSIQVGLPKTIDFQGHPVSTGIFKAPVSGPLLLRTLNLDGDGQADLRVHGGRDKALYAYGFDAYPAWQAIRPQDSFPFGAMGENLSIDFLSEDKIYVGDTYKVGDAVIQVAQPRLPCHKLAIKFNDPAILKQFMKLERPGVYFRVLQEGIIKSGDELHLTSQEKVHFSITEFFNLVHDSTADHKRLQEIVTVGSIPPNWREKFKSRLKPA